MIPSAHAIALLILLAALAPPTPAAEETKPEDAARIESVRLLSRVRPGGRVVVAVNVKLAAGYHAHSNKPSEQIYIPTELNPSLPEGIQLLATRYPDGKTRRFPGLPKPLSIYEDEVEIRLILKLDENLALPAKVPATLSYQACKGKICYRPAKVAFEISLPRQP